MKTFKKIASLLLAMVMILGLTTSVFAVGETGSITVDNPQKDQIYTAYKIFDVVYDTKEDESGSTVTGDHYAYTIDSNNKWLSTVQTYANTAGSGLKLEQVNDSTTYVVTEKDGFSASKFAAALQAALKEDQKEEGGTHQLAGEELTVSGGVASVDKLALGYYFVTSTSGALCNLTTTNPNVTIHDKNDVPFDKEDDKENVEIGEVVNYTITGKVPDATGFETYLYQITDKMSDGLTFNNDVKVFIGQTPLERDTDYTIKTGPGATVKVDEQTVTKDFVLDINVLKQQENVGKMITVTYSAMVNENAAGKIENNHATLEYSNDPTDNTQTTTLEDKEKVYSAKIIIDKYAQQQDTTDTTKKLAGAKFVLYKMDGMAKKYYKYTPKKDATATETAVEAKVDWVEALDNATVVTTDETGAANFLGLKDGTYQLLETEAPAGYNKLTEPVTVDIAGTKTEEGTTTIVEANLSHTEHVANNTGSILPGTGGMGTTLFYVIGAILVIGAAVLLIAKRCMGTDRANR